MSRVAIIVCAWNHLETTTRPCLESVRRFTDREYRLLVVDNASTDATPSYLARVARHDDRITLISSEVNRGWAGGTTLGLEALVDADTHACMLNSDTLVTPGWLSRMLTHLESQPGVTGVTPNEYPDIAGPLRRLPRRLLRWLPRWLAGRERGSVPTRSAPCDMVPGTRVAAPAPPLDEILRLAGQVASQFRGRSHAGAPSGYCFLTARRHVALLREYLADFDRYRAGTLDWQEFWARNGASARIAQDVFVFHARGGSGGYYAYDRERAL